MNRKKCNNTIDFYTFDKIDDIEEKYFYSYKDNKGFIWGFDIRSFHKLIEMKQNNPYNREKISNDIIQNVKIRIHQLKQNNEYEILDDEIKLTRKQLIKQNIIDLFSQLEQYGYECNIDWFLKLNIYKLKKLYKLLEDIWNYRLQLSQQTKNLIVPPDGLIFNIPISMIMSYNNIIELQEILINELKKFNRSNDDSYKKLGFMYFLIGLGGVSRECFMAHQWLMNI